MVGFETIKETVIKGFIKTHLLRKFTIHFLDQENRILARMSLSVDWDKHEAYLASPGAASFTLDINKGAIGQIARILDILVAHMEAMMRKFPIVRMQAVYNYIDDVTRSPEKERQADKDLGLVDTDDKDKKKVAEFEKTSVVFRVKPGRLDEIDFYLEHRR